MSGKVKLTIGKKIFLGYLPLISVIVLITGFALFRLNQVHAIFKDVIFIDIKVSKSADDMIEALHDMESSLMRYLILQSYDMYSLMLKQTREYELHLNDLKTMVDAPLFEKLVLEYSLYKKAKKTSIYHLSKEVSEMEYPANQIRAAAFIRQGELLKLIQTRAEQKQGDRTNHAVAVVSEASRVITAAAFTGLGLALTISFFMTGSILRSVRLLKNAAELVSKGIFQNLPTVDNSDEMGELSYAFNKMALRLISLEEDYRSASPLTGLPGGTTIESEVQSRIKNQVPLAFCMFDLDNFKPFNDRYGYSRGNQVIKQTTEILKKSVQIHGSENDFIGHIGGDDFVVITTPDHFEKLCKAIMERFDGDILNFYDKKDYQSGCIVGKNRKGNIVEFPIMTISICVVNSKFTDLKDYIQVGEIVAELKTYVKSFKGSNMVVDRRIKMKSKNR